MSFIRSVKYKFKFLCIRIVAPAILNCIFLFARRREKTIILIKTDGIGDYILFRNYLQFLRSSDKFRNYKIYLLTNPANKDLVLSMDSKFVDSVFWYADSYFLKWKLVKLLLQLQRLRASTLFYPNYSRRYTVDWLVKNITANNKIAVDGDAINEPAILKLKADKYYSELIILEPGFIHEFDRNKQIFEKITGQKCDYIKPFFNNNELNIIPNKSIIIFPGGSESGKRWSPVNFNRLCKQIISKLKTNIILTGGKDEAAIGKKISKGISTDQLSNQIGLLSLVELCSVIGGAKLLISNDSVAIHIAAALNIPVISISKGDLYGRFIPYPTHIYNKIKNITPPDFQPAADKYQQWSSSNINNIPVEDVFNPAQQLLNNKTIESS